MGEGGPWRLRCGVRGWRVPVAQGGRGAFWVSDLGEGCCWGFGRGGSFGGFEDVGEERGSLEDWRGC